MKIADFDQNQPRSEPQDNIMPVLYSQPRVYNPVPVMVSTSENETSGADTIQNENPYYQPYARPRPIMAS